MGKVENNGVQVQLKRVASKDVEKGVDRELGTTVKLRVEQWRKVEIEKWRTLGYTTVDKKIE